MKNIDGKTIYTVTEINNLARQTLETLSFWVEGEISSFKGPNSHYRYLYFDLKDPQTGYKIPCILEPEIYSNLGLELTDGDKVLALGNLTLYEKEGRFQMYLHKIEEFGKGFLLAELERLKKKLEAKGYFDPRFKKSLPPYPKNIAVITSKMSDAWHDFKKHSSDRFAIIGITLFDVMVQGQEAAKQITFAVKKADQQSFDAIVLIRGGGSIEDLAAYNNENLAEAIFSAKTCIVTGIGHEKDTTIAQLVADVPASTPTDAAKIIVAGFVALGERLPQIERRITIALQNLLASYSQHLDILYHRLSTNKQKFASLPSLMQYLGKSLTILKDQLIDANVQKLALLQNDMAGRWQYILLKHANVLKNQFDKLTILSPQNTLGRGYSITFDSQNRVVKNAGLIAIGDILKVKLAKGNLKSKVLGRQNDK